MVTLTDQTKFIEKIAPLVQEIAPKYNLLCPSAIIAQACLESAYGTSSKADHHNYFGLKYRKNRVTCNSGYFKDGSKEERSGGKIENISDYWYAFADMAHGVEGYCQFLGVSTYDGVHGVTDPEAYLTRIRAAGYATSSKYVTNVMAVVRNHNLIQYDVKDINVPTKTGDTMNLTIIKNTGFRHHNTSNRSGKIEYIVLHYTASVSDAKNQISYFNSSKANNSSADFFVAWNGDVYQYNMEISSRYSWAVGGGRQSSSGGTFYGKCINRNSISIEMCCKSKTGRYVGANNANWYFTDETVEAALLLVRKLMDEYGIDADHVIRHYDVNGKYCPGIKGWNAPSGSESAWKSFKSRLRNENTAVAETSDNKAEKPAETKAESTSGSYLVKVTISTLRIRKGPGTGYDMVRYITPGIYTIVETKGNWGRLKSGAGWICLDYARRV